MVERVKGTGSYVIEVRKSSGDYKTILVEIIRYNIEARYKRKVIKQ